MSRFAFAAITVLVAVVVAFAYWPEGELLGSSKVSTPISSQDVNESPLSEMASNVDSDEYTVLDSFSEAPQSESFASAVRAAKAERTADGMRRALHRILAFDTDASIASVQSIADSMTNEMRTQSLINVFEQALAEIDDPARHDALVHYVTQKSTGYAGALRALMHMGERGLKSALIAGENDPETFQQLSLQLYAVNDAAILSDIKHQAAFIESESAWEILQQADSLIEKTDQKKSLLD